MSLKGRAAGALGKMKNAKDVYKSNSDLAFRIGDTGLAIGRVGGSEDGPLTLTEGPQLNTGFFTKTLFEGVKGAVLIDAIEQISETEAAKTPEIEGSTGFWSTAGTELLAFGARLIGGPAAAVRVRAPMIVKQAVAKIGPPFEGRLASPATFPGGFTGKDFNEFIVNLRGLKGEKKEDGGRVTQAEIDKILSLYEKRYNSNMKLKSNFVEGMRYLLDSHGESRANNIPVLIPLELELSIDGIGGIYPGNSYHSSYVPSRYQKEAIFQCFDVNHTVDSSGWTVSLTGKMRATLHGLYSEIYTDEENVKELTDKIIKDFNIVKSVKKGDTLEGQIEDDVTATGTTKSGAEIKRLQTFNMPHPVLSDLGYTGIYLKNMETGELSKLNLERTTQNLITKKSEFIYRDNQSIVPENKTYSVYYLTDKSKLYFTNLITSKYVRELIRVKDFDLYEQYTAIKSTNREVYPSNITLEVTDKDYTKGFVIRYFVKKANDINAQVFEISKADFNKNLTLYDKTKFNWIISGVKEEVLLGNLKTMGFKEKQFKGISKMLFPLQYWRPSKDVPVTLEKKLSLLKTN
jgi:hypothetical protein